MRNHGGFLYPPQKQKGAEIMSTEPFESLPDVLDVTLLAEALHLSKAGAYNLLNRPDFPRCISAGAKSS